MWFRLSLERKEYLQRTLEDDMNYAQDFVNKFFLYCHHTGNKKLMLEFIKNLPEFYFNLGKKSFEKFVLPNLKDCIILGDSNILISILETIKVLPLKADVINASFKYTELVSQNPSPKIEELLPFLEPTIVMLIMNAKLQKQDLPIESFEDLEPFLKPNVNKKLVEYFKSEKELVSKAKLETLDTVVLLFNLLMEDYQLQKEDIDLIKVIFYV